jgi:hypothetical protein
MATWEEVQSQSEAFILHGKADAVRAHCNLSGLSPQTFQAMTEFFNDWHGPPEKDKYVKTEVMTLPEYEASSHEFFKNFPADMRDALTRTKWNVKPEKVIVYTFASTDPENKDARFTLATGAFRTNGLWYFAAGYME